MAAEPSSQTFTFLFTDLEGSTRLWERHPQAMEAALARHDALLRQAVETSGGRVIKTTGDGLSAVFESVAQGLNASLMAQQSLLAEVWQETGPLKVRIGLHVGEAQPRGGDYYGPAVNRAARLMAAAHGGQILLSGAAASLVAGSLPQKVSLRDLGEHRLKDLEQPEHIFQLIHPEIECDFPPLATLDQRPNNLPAQPGVLIGRETELGAILQRLGSDGVRLLTLTGPGGIGKTRIALQAAAELIEQFPDGVFFIDLALVSDPQAVAAVVAQTLGIRETPQRAISEELISALRAKTILLLLDNFEQVTTAAPLAADLLQNCQHLKLLVTSREALRLRGEYVFPLPPLELPGKNLNNIPLDQLGAYEAVRLFVERAKALNPHFDLTAENARQVAQICQRLDGLPLAIELAAARTRLFSPQALLERLEHSLGLLRGGARDLPARQQTLHNAINWSYELLNANEQWLFKILSVFSGGCTLDSVESVAERMAQGSGAGLDVLDTLTSLVEKSLVRQVLVEMEEPRLRMLETIREFAAGQLAADPGLQADALGAHAAFFADFSSSQAHQLAGSRKDEALAALSADLENVRAAWEYWLAQKDLERLGKFVDSLWFLNDERGWYHATAKLSQDLLSVLSTTPASADLVETEVMLLTSLARALLVTKGYTPEVEDVYERALERSRTIGYTPKMAPILKALANLSTLKADFEKGARFGEQILQLAEQHNDDALRVDGHLVLGENLAFLEDLKEGLRHLEQGIARFNPRGQQVTRFRTGNNPGVACYTTSALFLWILGYPNQALLRAREAVDLAITLNHPYSMAYAYFHNSLLHLWRQEADDAGRCALAVVDIAEAHEMKLWKAAATCLYGAALAGSGFPGEGLAHIQEGMEIYRGLRTPPIFWPLLLHIQAGASALAGQPEQGLALIEDALQIASQWSSKALAPEFILLKGELLLAVSRDNAAEAGAYFEQAYEIAASVQAQMPALRAAASLYRLRQDALSRDLLRQAYAKISEGFDTADLVTARALLEA